MLVRDDTTVVAVCEPSPATYAQATQLFDQHGRTAPPNEPDWERFVATFAGDLDAVIIITPHAFHFAQATRLPRGRPRRPPREADGDDRRRGRGLIATRDRTGRLLVVAFQGSLSPQVREASRLLRSGELGPILNINATSGRTGRPSPADVAPGSGACPAAASCSTPAPTC